MKAFPAVLLILVLPAAVLLTSCGHRERALLLADEALTRLLEYQGLQDRDLKRMAGKLGFRLEVLRPGEDGQFSPESIGKKNPDLVLAGGSAFSGDLIPGEVPLVALNAAAQAAARTEVLSLQVMPDLLDEDFLSWLGQPADALIFIEEEMADYFRTMAGWNTFVSALEGHELQWLSGEEDLSLQRNRIEARLADVNRRVVLLATPETAQDLRPRNPARQDRLFMPYLSDRSGMKTFFPLDYSWLIMEILSSAGDADGPVLHILLPFQ